MLQEGGNAFDACVAASAMLSVTLPCTGGMGGDAFVIAKSQGRVFALNSSGRYALEAEGSVLRQLRAEGIPELGPLTITVPGLVEAWRQVTMRFCTLPVSRLLQPAQEAAAHGFPVGRRLQRIVGECRTALGQHRDWLQQYGGLSEGSTLRQPGMASALERLVRDGLEEFYVGGLARELVHELRAQGCPLSAGDFESHRAEWVEPLSAPFRGLRAYEIPPNSQGVTTLQLLRMYDLEGCSALPWGTPEQIRTLAEMVAVVREDREKYIADPTGYRAPVETMLSDSYLRARLAERTFQRLPDTAIGDTSFLAAADKDGNVIGIVQSLFHPFGSGIMAGGIPWHNRALGFDLLPNSPNQLEPGKRPRHTLSAMLAEGEDTTFCIGCAGGGDLRPQLHVMTLTGVAARGLDLEDLIHSTRALVLFRDGKPYMVGERTRGSSPEALARRVRGAVGRITTPPRAAKPEPGEPSEIDLKVKAFPSETLGIVNAIQLGPEALTGVSDPRGEGLALGVA